LHRITHLNLKKKVPKKNENVCRIRSMGLGGMDPMLGKRKCKVDSCGSAAVTTLDHQAFCLNHFLLRCYEKLEVLDPRGRQLSSETVDLAPMRSFIEECSRKALDVSLQSENLSNLQRGRLLDILLWAGELFVLLRAPRATLAPSTASPEGQFVLRTTSPDF
jgi:hypothetical protein